MGLVIDKKFRTYPTEIYSLLVFVRSTTWYRFEVLLPSNRVRVIFRINPMSIKLLSATSTVFLSIWHSSEINLLDGKQVWFAISACRSRQQYTVKSRGLSWSSKILFATIKKSLLDGCVFIISILLCKKLRPLTMNDTFLVGGLTDSI